MDLLGAHFTYLAVLSSGPHLGALRNAWRTCGPACAYIHTLRVQCSLFPIQPFALIMVANILDASALLQTLPSLLPPGKKKLDSQQDAIAALVHTALTVLGFRLTAVDESTPTRTSENNALPEEWNQHGPGNYAFKYRHEQSSLEFLVKVTKLGSRTLVNSIAVEVSTCLVLHD